MTAQTERSDGPLSFDTSGLIPAVIQESESNTVLMIGFMNAEALQATRDTGRVHFWSRSRSKLWRKGETSGHEQIVDEIRVNCERNSLLIQVSQIGAVCHDGYRTCFYRRLTDDNALEIVMDRSFDPASVYGSDMVDALSDLTRKQFDAYLFLRANDLTAVSGTAARLRAPEDTVTARLRDELLELAGALDGTHRHHGFADDVLLESGQVVYWSILAAIRAGLSWNDLRPDRALATHVDGMTAKMAATLIRADSATWSTDADPTPLHARLHSTLGLVGQALAVAGHRSESMVEQDLGELRGKDYLASVFTDS